jgi:transposase
MFVRRATRSYKGKSYTNYLLVESVRTPAGPRQKVICSLGNLEPAPREEWLGLARKLEQALVGQADLIEPDEPALAAFAQQAHKRRRPAPTATTPGRIAAGPQAPPAASAYITLDPSRVTTERHREAGTVHVGHQFWERLGLEAILQDLGLPLAARQLACAMALNRLIAPASEHAMPAWIRRTALADILAADFDDLAEDKLYRILDVLHRHRAAIETALVERERSLFNLDPTIYLYDLTSTYFEGLAMANPKARRGYSRDGRPDCKQVVVGLAVGREGFPICHEVFAGNAQDGATLAAMLDRLAERVGLAEGATVVVDRGLSGADNLALLKQRKLHYVVASRQSERDRWLADFAAPEGFAPVLRTPSPTNPGQKKSRLDVLLQQKDGHTHVLCRSQERIAKDRAIRAKHEQRLLVDLDKLQKRLAEGRLVKPQKIGEAIGRLKERYPRVARYYDLTYDAQTKALSTKRDETKYGIAEQLDGTYLLKTDRTDLSAEDAWRLYSLLTRAEDAFRDMKTPLAERPIFHQIERRVEAHIFLCVIAFHLLVAIEKTLRDHAIHTSWANLRDTLKTHQVCTIVLPTKDGACLRIRKAATPDPEVQAIYQSLGIPTEVIKPTKNWDDPPRSD